MTAKIGQKAAQLLFSKHIASIQPEDPLYAYEDDPNTGKAKMVRRLEPEGLSARDIKILQKIKRRAHRLDKGFNLCGFRVGYAFWLSWIPGVGDITDLLLGTTLIIRPAKHLEIPGWLVSKMYGNMAVQTGGGLIPIVGSIFVGAWKGNSRNCHLIEEYLSIRGAEYLIAQGWESDVLVDLGHTQHDPALREQYKPGAGIRPGEVIVPRSQQHHGSSTGQKGGFMSLFRRKADAVPAASSYNPAAGAHVTKGHDRNHRATPAPSTDGSSVRVSDDSASPMITTNAAQHPRVKPASQQPPLPPRH